MYFENTEESPQIEEINPMSYNIGESNYSEHLLQPWDIIDAYQLNYYEGNIIKYLLRTKDNRVEDLSKLIHYAQKEIANIERMNID